MHQALNVVTISSLADGATLAGAIADALMAVAGVGGGACAGRLPGRGRVRAAVQLGRQRRLLGARLQYYRLRLHYVPHLQQAQTLFLFNCS